MARPGPGGAARTVDRRARGARGPVPGCDGPGPAAAWPPAPAADRPNLKAKSPPGCSAAQLSGSDSESANLTRSLPVSRTTVTVTVTPGPVTASTRKLGPTGLPSILNPTVTLKLNLEHRLRDSGDSDKLRVSKPAGGARRMTRQD